MKSKSKSAPTTPEPRFLNVDGQRVGVEMVAGQEQAFVDADRWLISKAVYKRALAAIEANDAKALLKALEKSALKAG